MDDKELINEEVKQEVAADVVAEEPKKEKKVKKEKDPKKNAKGKKEEESWFIKVLKEEHKWETYLLGFISCVAIGIGALILTDVLVFKADTPVLSDYPHQVGWVFEIFGIIGFLLFIIPIFKPTTKEAKHLNLPTRTLFLTNVSRVFIFLTIMACIFMLYESVISAILGKFI